MTTDGCPDGRLRRRDSSRLLLTAVAAAALAAPATAAAAAVTYDVTAFTFLRGTATGTDNDGWNSSSSFHTEIEQQIDDIKATDDQDSIVGTPTRHRISVSNLKQDYSLATAMGTYTWGCVNDGSAEGVPGSVTMSRKDGMWTVELGLTEDVVQARDCTGFSSFEDEITITPGPIAVTWTFSEEELAKDPSSAPRKVEIIFGKKGSRALRRRGSVVIDVRSGGQSRSVRLNAR